MDEPGGWLRFGLSVPAARWDGWRIPASMSKSGSSISSSGDSSGGAARGACRYLGVAGSAASDMVRYDGSGLMVGYVPRRGRIAAAPARVGRWDCGDEMHGLGPQLDAGEKNGEVGLPTPPEKVDMMVLSE